MKFILAFFLLISFHTSFAQLAWKNVDSLYQPLPKSVHIYFTDQPIDTGKFRAYYVIADLKDKNLDFTVDTSRDRRLTPMEFYKRNAQPLLVVNTTFFSYATNRSLNTVIMNGELVAFNSHTIYGRGKDTFTYRHPFSSAFGISRKRNADIAWLYTDSATKSIGMLNRIPMPLKDSSLIFPPDVMAAYLHKTNASGEAHPKTTFRWKMQSAVGGGPVLLQNGEIFITNEEEMKFAGKAINDKHPRTVMGYTRDQKLIILMIEGRNKQAGGATLRQEAQILKDLGCVEAINLDGGGSSCMLINGKETIKPSDLIERPVPAVFIIRQK